MEWNFDEIIEKKVFFPIKINTLMIDSFIDLGFFLFFYMKLLTSFAADHWHKLLVVK